MLTKDFLPNTYFKIVQDDEMFRINTDTEVLGGFLEVYKKDLVYDFGCGNGALMLYASLFNPAKIVGIDINKKALDLAKINLDNNGITNYELINEDLKVLKIKEADVIICNPPYMKTEEANLCLNEHKKIAKHEYLIILEELVKSINRNLKDGGTLYFLFQTKRIEEVFLTFAKYNLQIKELQFVYPRGKEYSLVFMVKARKNAKSATNVLKPITI